MAQLNNAVRFMKKWIARAHSTLTRAASMGFSYTPNGRKPSDLTIEELGEEVVRDAELLTALVKWCTVEYLRTNGTQLLDLAEEAKRTVDSLNGGHVIEL